MAAAEDVFDVESCEPTTSFGPPRNVFKVTRRLRDAIVAGPETLTGHRCETAYVFGCEAPSKKVFREQWARIGYHANDGAMTGLIDVTGANPAQPAVYWDEQFDDILLECHHDYSIATRKCHAADYRMLWLGKTPGGDVGAEVYVPAEEVGKAANALIVNVQYYNLDATDEELVAEAEEEEIMLTIASIKAAFFAAAAANTAAGVAVELPSLEPSINALSSDVLTGLRTAPDDSLSGIVGSPPICRGEDVAEEAMHTD